MTNGISPKVLVPLVANAAIGVLLLVLWVISSAGDYRLDDVLFIAGCGFLGAGGVGFGLGYRADPGDVVETVGPGSDDLMPPSGRAKLSEPVVGHVSERREFPRA